MKQKLMLTAAGVLLASTATAQGVVMVEDLDNEAYHNKQVRISGQVADVEDANEFTLADKSGRIEVNLAQEVPALREGDFVTVVATLDPTLIDELDNAAVTVHHSNYTTWQTRYRDTYNETMNLDGMDDDM